MPGSARRSTMYQNREEELFSSPIKSHASSTVSPFLSPRNTEDNDNNEKRNDDALLSSLSEATSVDFIEPSKESKLSKKPKQLSHADFGKDIIVPSSINNNKKSRGCAEKMQEEVKRLRELATDRNDKLCPTYSTISPLDDRPGVQPAQKSKFKRGYWKVSSSSAFVQKMPHHVTNEDLPNMRGNLSLLSLGMAQQSLSSSLRQLPSSSRRAKQQSLATASKRTKKKKRAVTSTAAAPKFQAEKDELLTALRAANKKLEKVEGERDAAREELRTVREEHRESESEPRVPSNSNSADGEAEVTFADDGQRDLFMEKFQRALASSTDSFAGLRSRSSAGRRATVPGAGLAYGGANMSQAGWLSRFDLDGDGERSLAGGGEGRNEEWDFQRALTSPDSFAGLLSDYRGVGSLIAFDRCGDPVRKRR